MIKLWMIFCVVLLSACTGNVVKDQETVTIGGIFIQSGLGSDWGTVEQQAVQLAIKEYNSKNNPDVRLAIEVTSYDNAKTVSAIQKLIATEQPIAIIGPTWLGGLQGAQGVAQDNNIVLITPSEPITVLKSEQPYPYTFSTWYRTDEEAPVLAKYLAAQGKQQVVFVYGKDPFWEDFKNYFSAAAKENNIVFTESYSNKLADKDYRTILLSLKTENPDAILFGLDDEAAMYNFLKQRKEFYPDAPLYTTEMISGFIENSEYAGLLDGVSYIQPKQTESDFTKKYETEYDTVPTFSASNAYDATNIILESVRAGNTDGPSIRKYIATHTFDTVTFGKVRFDGLGGIQGGEFEVKTIP